MAGRASRHRASSVTEWLSLAKSLTDLPESVTAQRKLAKSVTRMRLTCSGHCNLRSHWKT